MAGPVVAGAVVLPGSASLALPTWVERIKDSKLLNPAERQELAPLIQGWVRAFGIGFATVAEIEEHNILHASFLAMKRAVHRLPESPEFLLVDGNMLSKKIPLGIPAQTIVKGDARSLSIACAAILAKVWRDDLMQSLDRIFPGYRLGVHKGYATAVHRKQISELGPCNQHRPSFLSVRPL